MTPNDGHPPHDALTSSDSTGSGETGILLASERRWLLSSMRAVLEPEGYALEQAESAARLLHDAEARPPGVVIIDEGLPDCSVSELCGELLDRGLPRSMPILVYSAAFWEEAEETAAMRAGAWDVIREPIRSRLLVEKLRRLLEIRRLIEAAEEDAMGEDEAGTLTLGGLFRVLGILGSLARRQGVGIGCAVLGPTDPAVDREGLAEQRSSTAELVARYTRRSDVFAWVGDADLALFTFGATGDGLRSIVTRLSHAEEASSGAPAPGMPARTLSAGLTELDPDTFREVGDRGRNGATEASPGDRVASLSQMTQAQAALRSVRQAGGGIATAELS